MVPPQPSFWCARVTAWTNSTFYKWLMLAPCVGKSFVLIHPTKRRVGSPDLCTQSKEKNEL